MFKWIGQFHPGSLAKTPQLCLEKKNIHPAASSYILTKPPFKFLRKSYAQNYPKCAVGKYAIYIEHKGFQKSPAPKNPVWPFPRRKAPLVSTPLPSLLPRVGRFGSMGIPMVSSILYFSWGGYTREKYLSFIWVDA